MPLPFGSIRIGSILGISIEINFTWFIIFALVTLSLGTAYFPQQYPDLPAATNFVLGFITSILFFGSVIFHELFHSIVAKLNNLPIRKITLFIFGGVAQMTQEPSNPGVEFKMAVAGPLSSLGLAFIFGLIWLLGRSIGLSVFIIGPAQYLSWINALLAVFNLLPGFPLDGGRVLRAGLWGWSKDITSATRIAARVGEGFAYLLIFVGFVGVLAGQWGLGWFILIGWFLQQAAASSYQHVLFERALSSVKVADIMSREVQTVDPDLTLERLVDEYFLRFKFGRFPVVKNGELLGIITLHDIKEVPREEWAAKTAKDILTPLEKALTVRPQDEAVKALTSMAQSEVGHLLVVEDGGLVGLVTRSDIIRLIKVKSELGV
jgi:Zn-dependent protease/CBS domain-containing protein